MKRSVLILTLAAVLVVAFAGVALAKTPVTTPGISAGGGVGNQAWRNLFSGPYNPGYEATQTDGTGPFTNAPTATGFAGYLRWDTSANGSGAQVWSGDGSTSPHGNYTTTTNKCAVCHSVHQATVGGTVLTAWGGTPAGAAMDGTSVRARASSSCIFCHGQNATFTPVRVNNMTATSITPHTYCGRCHTVSPHGAGASEFPVLAQKLFHDGADAHINTDATKLQNATGMAPAQYFALGANEANGVVIGTGYLCGYCHSGGAFAVPTAGYSPTAGGYSGPVNEGIAFANTGFTKAQDQITGHRVLAQATSSWNATVTAGDRLPDGTIAATDTGNPFRVAQFVGSDWDASRTIAWAPANSCQACHAARTFWGAPAFPHNYVNTEGASVSRSSTTTPGLGSSYVWLTSAGDADDTQEIVIGTRGGALHNAEPLTRDGLCLKCHVSGDRSLGVGINY